MWCELVLLLIITAAIRIEGLTWEWTFGAGVPCENNVVVAGVGPDRHYVYMGRVQHQGSILPAVVQYYNNSAPAVYTYRGKIYTNTTYEVLCGEGVAWQAIHFSPWQNNPFPPKALPVGFLADGHVLYACRYGYLGSGIVVPGLIDPVTKQCNVSSVLSHNNPHFNAVGDGPYFETLIVV